MTDETENPPEPPPLWGEAAFTRADGSSIAAQIRVSGEGARIETSAALEKGEPLTGVYGQSWIVAETKSSAGGGYSWAALAPAAPAQPPVNLIAPEPEAPPRPAPKKAADDSDDDASDDESDD